MLNKTIKLKDIKGSSLQEIVDPALTWCPCKARISSPSRGSRSTRSRTEKTRRRGRDRREVRL